MITKPALLLLLYNAYLIHFCVKYKRNCLSYHFVTNDVFFRLFFLLSVFFQVFKLWYFSPVSEVNKFKPRLKIPKTGFN